MSSKRFDNVVILAFVVLTTLAIYLCTLTRGPSFGDYGEFQTVPYVLGITHPTGYPTFTLIAQAFRLIPAGSPAVKINFMTALFGVLSVFLLYEIMMQLTYDPISSSTAALTLAFTSIFWENSIHAEVGTLNSFFLSSNLLLILLWRKNKENSKLLYTLSLTFGLGLGNHMSLLLYAPILALMILCTDIKILVSKKLVYMLVFFIVGCSVYLYIIIRDTPETRMNYLYIHRFDYSKNTLQDRFDRMLWLIQGKQYNAIESTYAVFTSPPDYQGILSSLKELTNQITWFGAVLAIIGIFQLIHRDGVMLGATGLIFLLTILRFGMNLHEVWSIPVLLVSSMWIGFGVNSLRRRDDTILLVIIAIVALTFLSGSLPLFRGKPDYDFKENLKEALVSVETAGESRSCDWSMLQDIWVCEQTSNTVERSIQIVDGETISCIWAHPIQDGVVKITYPATPKGNKIKVRAFFPNSGRGCADETPVNLRVRVHEEPEVTMSVNKLKPSSEVTIQLNNGKSMTAEFMVETLNARCKHYCFDAQIY